VSRGAAKVMPAKAAVMRVVKWTIVNVLMLQVVWIEDFKIEEDL